ncbi:hypothetical protein [Natronobacterium gregoryi]|uniref:DUF1102 domain-containing protein n=2 Tax=Natronobacterium gregoryi TaxID=44930 RepID=L0AI93_NATGS|nr:hypothetical protein [Natronobacterium gregoryi]AFZ73149.1 hypothetical protein Natgr_1966 [Natronobacterium gregoryi SP2]ELY70757.1 hypothetical protein C490_05677 [Natronobacterium gregoryi SP2]PLK21559.1 hypothetical protein CYV19_03085 [Natronobacterium gregoryi SP2]SFI60128.1 hypothetical protein SAMN05443661_102115 [Natronobacterium gregoryi]
MRRRTFIGGLGAITAGGSVVFGSGAFTSVEARRSITVETEDDHSAFLVLDEIDEGERADIDGGQLKFQFPGQSEHEYPDGDETDPEGLGSDSIYRFSSDVGADGPGLFEVKNQGTQSVEIYSTQAETNGVPSVEMYDVETGELLTADDPSASIGVGESLPAGLQIETHDIDTDSYNVVLTIHAAAPEN